jgi:hypothetical protein
MRSAEYGGTGRCRQTARGDARCHRSSPAVPEPARSGRAAAIQQQTRGRTHRSWLGASGCCVPSRDLGTTAAGNAYWPAPRLYPAVTLARGRSHDASTATARTWLRLSGNNPAGARSLAVCAARNDRLLRLLGRPAAAKRCGACRAEADADKNERTRLANDGDGEGEKDAIGKVLASSLVMTEKRPPAPGVDCGAGDHVVSRPQEPTRG